MAHGWSGLLLVLALAAPASAGGVEQAVAHVSPWPARARLAAFLQPVAAAKGVDWPRLLPVLLLDGGDPTPLPEETPNQWAQRLGAGVVASWHGRARPALVVDWLRRLAACGPLPDDLLWQGGCAAVEAGRPEAVEWLKPLLDRRPAAVVPLARYERGRGRLDEALALLAHAPDAAPWLMAELTALGRARSAGCQLDLSLRVPAAVVEADWLRYGRGAPLGDWLTVAFNNPLDQPARLTIAAQLAGLTEDCRADLTVPPRARLAVGLTPPLRLDVTSFPDRPVALRVQLTMDTAGGRLSLLDTSAPLPCRPRAKDRDRLVTAAELAERAAAAPPGEPPPPGALPRGLLDTADPTVTLAALLARQGRTVSVLTVGGRALVGVMPAERWGLIRAIDDVGAPVRPTSPTIDEPVCRRLGFLPTLDGGALQLDANRDGLPSKPGQALALGALPAPAAALEGSIDLSLPTPGGPSLWFDAAVLTTMGLPAALAVGRQGARGPLLALLGAGQPQACAALARTLLQAVDTEGQSYETVLEGRYGVLLQDRRGVSFFGDPRPSGAGAARALEDRERESVDRLLARCDLLWREHCELDRLHWRLTLAASGDKALADLALAAPAGELARVDLGS